MENENAIENNNIMENRRTMNEYFIKNPTILMIALL